MRKVCGFLFFLVCFYVGSFPALAQEGCIAVIPGTLHIQFWQTVVKGARDAAKELNVSIRVRAPYLEEDVPAQKKIVLSMYRHGCKGFVIAPLAASLNEEVAFLLEKKIPTVFIDRGTDGQDKALAILSTDNYRAGYLAGEEMVKQLKAHAKVAVLRQDRKVVTTSLRENGFIDAVKQGGLEVVMDKYLGLSYGTVFRETKKYLPELQAVDGIFTPNETVTQGVMMALMNEAHQDIPLHIGFDMNDKLAQGIENKWLYGVILQDPYTMGYKGVFLVHQAMNGAQVEREINSPVHFVTRENLSEYSLKKTP